MNPACSPACTHIVDDDEAIRDALEWLFKTRGVSCRTWSSGERFLEAWQPDWRGCIVLVCFSHCSCVMPATYSRRLVA